ncbi:unnamed protein product [Echinostoma caproni]|uniref:GST C-terminal domain-containing protein n=1 Tax=Echinostoma caproni TaxID=27848 RepID=A0A183BE64_9TREM|nr:unnamed protein product [Echinostoma caproni]
MGGFENLGWTDVIGSSDSDDRNALLVKLWEYFSTAAAGVCQLYRGKVDKCADFRCLIEALQPMDQFFKGERQFLPDLEAVKYAAA